MSDGSTKTPAPDAPVMIQRFSLNFRIQHIVLFTSVIALIVTGVPLWLALGEPGHIWADSATLRALGDFETHRLIHRIAGWVLIGVSVYHLFYISFTREGRREFMLLMPRWKDVTDVVQNVGYFFGLRAERPRFGRFTYYEKFDYWAVYWGCVIMIGTGLILYYPETVGRWMPTWMTYEFALAIHSDEAVLAFLALFVWHFYNVHYKPSRFPGTMLWWHGKISRHEMLEEHPLEYEQMLRPTNRTSEKP